jgi:predicted anti-sigma-YlaC factor YlaD
MKACFNTDELIGISAVLGPDVSERLDHLDQCGSCRSELAIIVAVRAALGDRAGVADERALATTRSVIRREAKAERAERPGQRWWGSAAETVFAGLTALALPFSSGVVGPDPGPTILMSVLCAGVVWISGHTRRASQFPPRAL